jgi:hypothetical protein
MNSSMLSRPSQTPAGRALLEKIDSAIRSISLSQQFVEHCYPTLIERQGLEDAGYREAFPHLLCDVSAKGRASSWCLSPAVCYHTFIALRGARLSPRAKITARNHCYRNERDVDPGRRQIEFEMRELVVVGEESWIEEQILWWKNEIGALASRSGIVASWKPATDPFFLPNSKGRALMQRLLNTKWEYSLRDGLALASINRHRDYFAKRFSIQSTTDLPVHSACIAFGLDRWAWAAGQRRSVGALNAGPAGIVENAGNCCESRARPL